MSERRIRRGRAICLGALALTLLCALDGCELAPAYRPPSLGMPEQYKERSAKGAAARDWKIAEPRDGAARSPWWSMFHDAGLDALEAQVNLSNQTIAASFASFEEARALAREARAQYWPSLGVSAGVTRERSFTGAATSPATYTNFALPFDASWTPDLWNRVRDEVRGAEAGAQASAADLENTRLTIQAELAVDYYELRYQDALIRLSDDTVSAYRGSLEFVRAQFETGVGTDEAVAQAEVQLKTTETQATNLRIARAQYEHAIALLVGRPASGFSLAPEPPHAVPPDVPTGVPSDLLERRPDIAAAERLMAQANAQIGVARAAYFPTLTLSGSAGYEAATLSKWLQWPSRVWAVGPSVAETIFDAGLRAATVEQYRAAFEQSVANYRQTVLTACQQVEDNLAALQALAAEVTQQTAAIDSSRRYLKLATDRYSLGLDPYIDVLSAQTALLANQQSLVNLELQQFIDSVQLIEALGGGWDARYLPEPKAIVDRK